MKRVVVLGSTGSVGRNTLEVIAAHPDKLRLAGVAARSRLTLLAEQVRRFGPPLVAVWEDARARECAQMLGRPVAAGLDGLVELATHPEADIVVVATSGRDALVPLLRAIQAGKRIALANKELLVMAGELIMRLVQEHGTTLVPVDSEHAGLFQVLQGVPRDQVTRLIITGSGGPLWSLSPAERQGAARGEGGSHPEGGGGPQRSGGWGTGGDKG